MATPSRGTRSFTAPQKPANRPPGGAIPKTAAPKPVPAVRGKNNRKPAPKPGRYAPGVRGGGGFSPNVSNGRPSVVVKPKKPNFGSLSTREQQQRLKAMGFDVTVDGIEGPQTKMARKAYSNGVNASYWNKVWLKNHPPGGAESSSGGTSVSSSGSSGSPPQSAPTTETPTSTTPSGTTTPSAPATTPVSTFTSIDPAKLAAQTANAEFNPQVQEALRALGYAQAQAPLAQENIQGWNKQVTNQFNTDGDTSAYDAAVADATAANQATGQLFGGDNAGEAAINASPQQGMLSALGASNKSFQDMMQGLLQAQGRDYSRRATITSDNDIADARSALGQVKQAKGQAQSKYLMDAQNTAISQQQAQQALDQAAALAGPQLEEAKARATAAATEAKNAPELARIALKQQRLATQAAIADLKAKAASANGNIIWNASNIDAASNGTVAGAIGEKGGMTISPNIALQNVLVAANGAGAPKSVVKAGIAKLIRALNISHQKGQWTAWKWNGKEFVFNKKKARPNSNAKK